jgi:hypothetical protein
MTQSNKLPVSRLIAVSVNLTPAGAQSQSLSDMLIIGNSDVIDIVERFRTFSSLSDVAATFGTSAKEYLAASLWFQQAPQPTRLQIGRAALTASKGGIRGATLNAASQALSAWNAIVSGGFTYTKDGGAPVNVTALNFSTDTTLSAVASRIQTAMTGCTVIWNSVLQRFEASSNTTGATSSLSFFTAPPSGADISALAGLRSTSSGAYLVQGSAVEAPVDAVALFDNAYGQGFYAVTFAAEDILVNADHLAVAAFVEGANNKHLYAVTTQEAAVLVAGATTDIAYQLQQLARNRTFVQYSSSNPYAAVSAMARLLTTDYTGNNTTITLMYKQEPGIVAEQLNGTQVDSVSGKNSNIFVAYNNNTAILQRGVMASGVFADIVAGTDWLAVTVQTSLYNLLYTSPTKIPQTDAGTNMLVTTVESVCAQAVNNGLLAPGVWNSAGFGLLKLGDFMPKGFYAYAPRVDAQNPTDRAARKSVPIQVAAKLAGAIHDISVAVVVNQ